ncbi:hypothetical protein O988_08316 [Pseudogymnoascus sp. VKM F-3808]|nr:hypothetical protein O988_08316 [Pseudogymnoascus sp. VKM F-3808]
MATSVKPIHGHRQAQGEPANTHELENLVVASPSTVNSNVHSNNSNQSTPTDAWPEDAFNEVPEQVQQNEAPEQVQQNDAPEQAQQNEVPEQAQQNHVGESQGPVSAGRSNTKTDLKILGLATLATGPLIILISVFLGILQLHVVQRTSSYILVHFQATRLLIPLQLAAIVAPFTIGILMKLRAYHVGRLIAKQRKLGAPAHQSRTQYAMLIEYLFFPGGLTTLRSLGYAMTPRKGGRLFRDPNKGRSEMTPILRGVIFVLCLSAFICFGLSLLVTVIQGVASVENYERVTILQEHLGSFGRELPPKCTETKFYEIDGVESVYSCSLKPGPGGFFEAEPTEARMSLNNESSVNSILWDSQNEIAFIAPPVVNRSTDFKAATIGIHSSCKPKGKTCRLTSNASNTIAKQSCSVDFRDANKPTTSLSLSQGVARAVEFTGPGEENPFHYWIWGIVQTDSSSSLPNDDEVLALDNSVSILLDCEVSIHNYTYTFTNGTLNPNSDSSSSGFTAPANTTLVNNTAAEVFIDLLSESFGQREIYERLKGHVAGLSSAEAIADAIGKSVSEKTLGYAAGLFVKTKAFEQSTREDMLVTRLPVALVTLCCLFGFLIVVEGIVLAILAAVDVRAERGTVDEVENMKLKELVQGRPL